MLSYMKDNNDNQGRQEKKIESQDIEQPIEQDFTQGITEEQRNVDQDEEYLMPAEHGREIKRSTIFLLVLFAAGILGLLLMIKKTTPSQANAATASNEEMQIENTISQLTGVRMEMDGKIDSIIDKFYQLTNVEQVTVGNLKKNPFRHSMGIQFHGMEDDISGQTLLREELETRAQSLQLLTIMELEDESCCMIGDRVLYEGDSIDGFKVHKIHSRKVELKAGNMIVTLKIPE